MPPKSKSKSKSASASAPVSVSVPAPEPKSSATRKKLRAAIAAKEAPARLQMRQANLAAVVKHPAFEACTLNKAQFRVIFFTPYAHQYVTAFCRKFGHDMPTTALLDCQDCLERFLFEEGGEITDVDLSAAAEARRVVRQRKHRAGAFAL